MLFKDLLNYNINMSYFHKWLLILCCAAMFIVCDTLSANWGKTGNRLSLVIMFALSPVAYLLFGILNKEETLSISSGLVNIMIIIGAILIGIFFFKDIVNVRQGIGLLLAIIAVILMS